MQRAAPAAPASRRRDGRHPERHERSPGRARPAASRGHRAGDAGRQGSPRRGDGLGWHGGLDSVGATAYLQFEYRLIRGLFDDELGDLARDYVGSGASWQATIGLLDHPTSPWWDDTTTTGRTETAPDIIAAALDAAGADLRGAYGDPKDWTWGRAHQAVFREQTLGESGIGPLEWYFNKGPVAVAGAAGAVRNNYYRIDRAYPDPNDPDFKPVGTASLFEVTTLPSYKLLIDMSDVDGARIVQSTGQSGNPGRQPLRRPDQPLGRWRDGAALLHEAGGGGDGQEATDADPVAPTPSDSRLRERGAQPATPSVVQTRQPVIRPRYSSLIGSGPSPTSIRTRPSSTTTG